MGNLDRIHPSAGGNGANAKPRAEGKTLFGGQRPRGPRKPGPNYPRCRPPEWKRGNGFASKTGLEKPPPPGYPRSLESSIRAQEFGKPVEKGKPARAPGRCPTHHPPGPYPWAVAQVQCLAYRFGAGPMATSRIGKEEEETGMFPTQGGGALPRLRKRRIRPSSCCAAGGRIARTSDR